MLFGQIASIFTNRSLILLLCSLFAFSVIAQEDDAEKKDDLPPKFERDLFIRDSTLDISSLYKAKDTTTYKKKKIKKNTFYGIKCRKAYTQTGAGNKIVVELFYVLKKYREPDPYAGEVYWYDMEKGRISTAKITEKERPYALILHGPYKKMIDEVTVEEGQFYIGTKHGRWEKYDKNYLLTDKVKYFKGWPKESKFEYYDRDGKKLKEVIPIVHGIEEGKYVFFYESGNIANEGTYIQGHKTGYWTESYDKKGWRKKVLKYPDEPVEGAEPEIVKEWNQQGKILIDKEKEVKQKQLEEQKAKRALEAKKAQEAKRKKGK